MLCCSARLNDDKQKGHNIPRATITVRCEELSENKDYINIQVAGDKLQKMDLFGKSDPYLQFFRVREDSTWVQVHQTEVVKTTLNPRWKPFTLTVQALCNGDMKRPILIKCWY
jgi:Ca2+-dependent lipid-binding protein